LWISVITALGLLGGFLAPQAALADGSRPNYLVKAKKEHSVPVAPVRGKIARMPRMGRWNVAQAPRAWPATGATDVALPAPGAAPRRADGLPISLSAAKKG
jgi:hypothetical protein